MAPGSPLELRVFIDASAVEVFTGTGQALSTRIYRGAPPDTAPSRGAGSAEQGADGPASSSSGSSGGGGGSNGGRGNVPTTVQSVSGSAAAKGPAASNGRPPAPATAPAGGHDQAVNGGAAATLDSSGLARPAAPYSTHLSLWAVGGSAEVVQFEVHEARCAWLRGREDAPLPPPVSRGALGGWAEDYMGVKAGVPEMMLALRGEGRVQ